jgi:dephospho-CoA kinase
VLGLTGSVGMGKSTTARLFAEEGVPVWDADATVHALYAPGGAAVEPLRLLCPAAVSEKGVDRAVLRAEIAADPGLLTRIEAVVHPLVAADRQDFIERAAQAGAGLVVLDMPLLFEQDGERVVDATLVVSAPPETQRARVLARPGMTEDHLEMILARQMPDSEKRARADFVLETTDIESARAAVRAVLAQIRSRLDA